MRYSARMGLVASLIAIAACEQPRSITAPVSSRAAPPDALASKQGTTSSQMLIEVLDVSNGNSDIGLVDDDGSNLVMLTSDDATEKEPAWAPDGKRVVFASNAFASSPLLYSLFSMNDDGTGVTRLTVPSGDYGLDQQPVGFAKGIVFDRYDPFSNVSAISLLDAGGGVTQLTDGYDLYPAPSPKGKSVAFTRGGDIYVLDLGTGALTNLSNTAGCFEEAGAYSPLGKQIAFTRFDCVGMAGGIFVMNDDGTSVTRLTTRPDGYTDRDPRWSPDGKRMAFTRINDGTGTSDIYAIDTDGTSLKLVLPADAAHNYAIGAWARY